MPENVQNNKFYFDLNQSGVGLDFLNINWFQKLSRGIKTAKKVTKSGFELTEDPTEAGIFSKLAPNKIMKIFFNHSVRHRKL